MHFSVYLWGIVAGHTEKQRAVGECHSTSQGAVAGGTPANLWLPQACALPQRGGPLASLGGPWREAAEAYQVSAVQGPGCRSKCQVKVNITWMMVSQM